MNVFTFTGNIGRNAEVRHTPAGLAICNFPVAVTSGFGDNKKTTWARCALFGKRAEGGLVQYLKKGAQVAVSGELSLNEFEGNDGQKRTSLEVRINEIDLIGGKPQQSQGPHQPAQPAAANTGAEYSENTGGYYDDDIPFAQHLRGTVI